MKKEIYFWKKLVGLLIVYFLFTLHIEKCEGEKIHWSGIVIHHSATNNGTVESIRNYHINTRKWDDIGYHFVIYADGTIHKGRSINKKGSHAKGRNDTHIGICLIGDTFFSKEQLVSLVTICKQLCETYKITSIERHHDRCPGTGIDVEKIENDVLNNKNVNY